MLHELSRTFEKVPKTRGAGELSMGRFLCGHGSVVSMDTMSPFPRQLISPLATVRAKGKLVRRTLRLGRNIEGIQKRLPS